MNHFFNTGKLTLASLLTGAAIFGSSFGAHAVVSQQPLSLTEGVAPNLLVTLDDSGSMAWAYAPDSISGQSGARAGRSSSYNSMYYNPAITYVIPKVVSLVAGEVVVTSYPTPSFTAAREDGFNVSSAAVNLSNNYRAQWQSFMNSCPSGVSCSSGAAAAHYFRYNVSGSCPATPVSAADACYSLVTIPSAQQTNFAIWYSFYRTRNLATRSAANLAFLTLPENVRITWGALNTCNIGSGSTSGTCNTNIIKRFSDAHRVNFFKWLSVLPQANGTPLHAALTRAGEFVKTNTKAYLDDDGSNYACRATYHILMTDGTWNGRGAGGTNSDGGLAYPYKDDQTNTLADLAYNYWGTDLRPSMPDKIKPFMPYTTANTADNERDPRNNPANWQHMVNFTLSLGLSTGLKLSTAPTWSGATFTNLAELLAMGGANGKRWPALDNDSVNNIYDLWHAAINSRGEFFSADSPDTLIASFSSILNRIGDRTASAAAPAINSGLQDDGTGDLVSYAFKSSYSSNDSWAGDLNGYKTTKVWNGTAFNITTTPLWSARNLLASQSWSLRNIQIAATSGTTKLKPLSWTNAGDSNTVGTLAYWLRQNPDNVDTLDSTDTLAQDRLAFLRGDRSKETTSFRKRVTVLGDMIASKPATVRGARYLTTYANKIERNDSYTAFLETQKTRVPQVYVGANDGMLHAFNANTGVETFAFVPTAVFSKLHKLTGKNYEGAFHQFYVEGSPTIADAYINNQWRTLLIGTLKAGGKGLFALDVTDPNAIKLLWEFSDSSIPSAQTVRLGYSFSQPTVARLHNGKWAVVVGNGYSSANDTNGKAALLVIDAATGALTKTLEVQGTAGSANGLSTPRLADMNVDGVADFAYAGDLQGNMWRFNLAPLSGVPNAPFQRSNNETSAAESSFKVSFGGKPLYTALSATGLPQAITAAPAIVRHPSRYGYMVIFTTGKYYEEGDKAGIANLTHSIYGIWDVRSVKDSDSITRQPTSFTRSKLQAQVMDSVLTAEVAGRGARKLTSNSVDWAEPPVSPSTTWTDVGKKYGWYFDFALPKELSIENLNVLGKTVFFQTLVPNVDPCISGVANWSYAIDAESGGRTLHHAFDQREVGHPETVISAIQQDGEGGHSVSQDVSGNFKLCTGTECETITPDPESIGRQSWRKVEEH
ncbi:MAG: PilC/PilY family type IV pilus protein [Pseudomonas sp.]|uniref:pilus assembly protein n=1 Tax=Pseudomonas sp. TaxID=306 RepID=UPI0033945EF3